MYDYLLFDLDGTIIDSGPGITKAVKKALEAQNITAADPSVYDKFVGPPLSDSFERYFGLTGELNAKAIADFRAHYRSKGMYECELYDGIVDSLRSAYKAGKTIILCTSKLETAAIDILAHLDIAQYFDIVAGGIDGIRTEKKDIVAYCLELIEQRTGAPADKSRLVMIGDRKFDVLGSAFHGIDSIGVLYGYGSREELTAAGATFIADTATDILKYI